MYARYLQGAANAVKKLDRFRELVLAVRDGEGEAGGEVDEKLTKAVKSALKQVGSEVLGVGGVGSLEL